MTNSSSELLLNWGIISTGLISQDFCTALTSLQSPLHVIRAVAARKLDDAKKFAEKFSIEMYHESYDKLFDVDNGVNIVYIGTINHLHKELCLKAIAAGKHVLCEKPMTLNSQEQEEVFRAAKHKNVFFMEVEGSLSYQNFAEIPTSTHLNCVRICTNSLKFRRINPNCDAKMI
jgi:predicted dehydrogenase